jgi:hypothetical protein
MSRAHALFRLQSIDSQLDEHRARLAEIEQALGISSEVQAAERRLEEKEDLFRQALAALSSAEHAVQAQREKIEQTEKTLYGGTVRNPKELQDLHRELESLQRYLVTLEDRLLEAMLAHEEAENALQAAKEALEHARARHAQETAALQQEREVRQKEVEKLEGQREAALASVAPDDLMLYQKLRSRLGGVAVASLAGDSCAICGVSISGAKLQQVRRGESLIQCGQCQRILFGG